MTAYLGGIRITTSEDMKAWDAAIARMVTRLELATGDASMAAGRAIGNIARAKLAEKSHGPLSFSPAGIGEPPATVSGDLAASIRVVRTGFYTAMAGPTTRYARIQELGGDMHGHPMMEFHKLIKGRIIRFREEFVHLFRRPYWHPSQEQAVNSGEVEAIYAQYWAGALEG